MRVNTETTKPPCWDAKVGGAAPLQARVQAAVMGVHKAQQGNKNTNINQTMHLTWHL
jgi:hypothetical protein